MEKLIERIKDLAMNIVIAIFLVLFGIYALSLAATILIAPLVYIYDFIQSIIELFS